MKVPFLQVFLLVQGCDSGRQLMAADLQVEFHHMGTYKLKGVAGTQCVMHINSSSFANRTFPEKAASSKAEKVGLRALCQCAYQPAVATARSPTLSMSVQVSPGKGLVYSVTLLPQA